MVRLGTLMLILLPSLCFSQEKADSITNPYAPYDSEVGTPWNGMLVSVMQNPAFAGFDRRLQFEYSYEGQNLKVPESYETKKSAFWNQTAIVDFAFGGKRNNVGVNITYNGGQQLYTDYHRLQIAHSFRYRFKQHKITIGAGVRYLKLEGGDFIAYGDMIDPVYGFVYGSQEDYKAETQEYVEYSIGLNYQWRRIFFGYGFRYEHRSLLATSGKDFHPVHHLHANYQLDFHAAYAFAAGFSAEYNGFNWSMEPTAILMWKGMVMLKLSSPNLNQFKTEVGIRIWRLRALYSFSMYFKEEANNLNGVASMSGGLRYNFHPFKTTKKK